MALRWADRILETSTTTGTGAFTLAGAVTGYRRFADVPSIATSDTCYYCIFAVDGNGNPSGAWETGLGTYSSADTLTRTTPSASTNGGAAVDFAAGTKYVMLTPSAAHYSTLGAGGGGDVPALLLSYLDELATDAAQTSELDAAGSLDGTELIHIVDGAGSSVKLTLDDLKTFVNTDPSVVPSSEPWRGARVYRTSDLTGLSSNTAITWQAEAIDTDGIWSAGAPTRLTVPSGVTKVRLRWGVRHEGLATAGTVVSKPYKNGSLLANGDGIGVTVARSGTTGFSDNNSSGFSGTLDVTGGTDYFEIRTLFSMSGQDQVLADPSTFFEMEIVEA